jgi:hypothetical protein
VGALTKDTDDPLSRLIARFSSRVLDDQRGALIPIDFDVLPFAPVRVFVVRGKEGAVRGGHAHRIGRQALVCLSGVIEVECRYGDRRQTVILDGPGEGVIIAAPVWSTQTYRAADASLLVLCETPFDPASYRYEP